MTNRSSFLHGRRSARSLLTAAARSDGFEPLEPRVLLAAEPLLAPFPQSILAHAGRNAAVVIDDIDGDGWNEVLVGNAGTFTAGRTIGYTSGAYVLSGRDGAILREHHIGGSTGVDFAGRFGWSLASLGDVDDDGVGDYAIGQPGAFSGSESPDPSVHIISGATGDSIVVLSAPADVVGFGTTLLGLGDVNGDGTPDLAVGGSTWAGGPVADGAVLIYSGADWSALEQIGGFGEDLGREIWDAGDLDGDGVKDFISAGNRVFSGADGSLLVTIATGSITGSTDSGRIVPVTDLDHDGQHDFIANISIGEGSALVAFSGADGSSIAVVATFDTLFGSIANIGDRDGDGFDEVALSISNSIQVRSSSDGTLLQTITDPDMRATTPGGAIGDGFYATALASGDVNNDGRTDLLALSNMLGGFLIPIGPGRTDLFFGQDVGDGPDLFERDVLDPSSELSITSGDGLVTVGVNPYGDLIAFTRTTEGGPVQMHTLLENGGVLTLDAFNDPRTGRLTVAISTYDGLKLFAFVPGTGDWVESEIDDSAGQITRLMQAFTFADGRIGLVGMGLAGEIGFSEGIMLYEQSGGGGWTFTNVTLDLTTHGHAGVTFDEFTVYVAPWNAVHITGRGPAGLNTVWRSHLTPSWVLTPIGQEVPEAQQLTNLSAFVAPWGGLHVAGVTPDGHVGVLWWSFELLETGWEYTDLTLSVDGGGPLFRQAPISTLVTDWGGLNIYGVNTDGDLAAYWWVPQFGAEWVAETIMLDPGDHVFTNPLAILDAVFEPQHRGMRLTARGEGDEIILYTWRPEQGGTWLFENLSANFFDGSIA